MQNNGYCLWLDAGAGEDGQGKLTIKLHWQEGGEEESGQERGEECGQEQGREAGGAGRAELTVCLKDPEGCEREYRSEISIQEMEDADSAKKRYSVETVFSCPEVRLWDCEHPVVYGLHVKLSCGGRELWSGTRKAGFRRLEKRGKLLLWNGTPLKLKGVCYRERKDDWEGTRRDLELFAKANINFLRSIYAPFSARLLEACDEMGFLVENTAPFYEIGQTKTATQDLPHCRESFIRPVKEMLEDGCHVSILIWSLGHDCAWGSNFREAAELIRSVDTVRPLTFHLPMSIPEEEEQMDIWPVHYADWKQPFDVCYDQMVIFHTPGAENEIGYMTGQADGIEVPVLHEVWSPVACHNRDEIERDPAIREFWGHSIARFAEKSYQSQGCLGGAVLSGVDEDGCFEEMGAYEWGILDRQHQPKPEYFHVKTAYSPIIVREAFQEGHELVLKVENRFLYTDLKECRLEVCGKEIPGTVLRGAPGSVAECRIPWENGGAFSSLHPQEKAAFTFILTRYNRQVITYEYTGQKERRRPDDPLRAGQTEGYGPLEIVDSRETDGLLVVRNKEISYRFSGKSCLLEEASAGGRRILAGGPYLHTTRLLLGEWTGERLEAVREGDKVCVTISGSYRDTAKVDFTLLLSPDGTVDTSYQVEKLWRHMPHTVKAEIGMDPGGLNEKGVWYLLDAGMEKLSWDRETLWESSPRGRLEVRGGKTQEDADEKAYLRISYPSGHIGRPEGEACLKDDMDFFAARHHIYHAQIVREDGSGVQILSDGGYSVRLERAPGLTPLAVIDDRDARMEYEGAWYQMDDYCGNYQGTESLCGAAGSKVRIPFEGTGIRLYGPYDINYGMCDIYLDGELAAANVSQYPDKVDFPGMSRGYEKRYGRLLYQVSGLPEGPHTLTVAVSGKAVLGAQNTYTAIDYAVLEGGAYPEGLKLCVNQDYNYARLVRGCYKRERAVLTEGRKESFRIRLLRH